MAAAANQDFLKAELDDLRTRCEKVVTGSKLIACVPQVVQVKITRTEFKELTAHFQFGPDYPASPLIIELKSKPLDFKLLQGLEKVCTEEAQKYLNKQQVGGHSREFISSFVREMMPLLLFIRKFIDDNPLCVCRGEVAHIQQNLIQEGDVIKLKQKTSQIHLTVHGGAYFIKVCFTVPDLYPLQKLRLECVEHNFPELFKQNFIGQCVEIARKAVEPPLRKNPKAPPFEPKPSLQKIADFLFKDCVKKYFKEPCASCKRQALPQNPKDIVSNPKADEHVERVYCGHIYHHKCLDVYMKTPPFAGGKKCLSCDARIFHDKWSITPEVAEARWAHKQAKERELDEVIDFMS